MEESISINQAIDPLAEDAGGGVAVHGILHVEFEDVSLKHDPVSEQRDELGASSMAQAHPRFSSALESERSAVRGKDLTVAATRPLTQASYW